MGGLPLELKVMVAGRMMTRSRKMQGKRGKAVQLQVPGPDLRMTGEVWWMGEESTGSGESWRGVTMGWLEGRWRGAGRRLQLELAGRREAHSDWPLPHAAGLAGGTVQRKSGEGGVMVTSMWVVKRS